MATLDHVILKVNNLDESIAFYTNIMGFENAGQDGPFTVIRVNQEFQIQLAPWQTDGYEHYAFSVSRDEFDSIFEDIFDA